MIRGAGCVNRARPDLRELGEGDFPGRPDHRKQARLIYALSGLGKTTLAEAWPDKVVDADQWIYPAVAEAFPELEPRARLRAWRALCRRPDLRATPEAFALWSRTRDAMFDPVRDALTSDSVRLVVTSTLRPPLAIDAYFGVELGGYLKHLELGGRVVDNDQSEALNEELDHFSPLYRLAPGTWLADHSYVRAALVV